MTDLYAKSGVDLFRAVFLCPCRISGTFNFLHEKRPPQTGGLFLFPVDKTHYTFTSTFSMRGAKKCMVTHASRYIDPQIRNRMLYPALILPSAL